MSKRILVTGAAGFIGHHLVEHLLVNTDWEIVAMVRVGGAGSMRRLEEALGSHNECHGRVRIVWHDLRSPINVQLAHELGMFAYIAHLAALTHVDNSIEDPGSFVYSNIVGTYNILEWARHQDALEWLNIFSTDEVFGPAPVNVLYSENSRYNATNPYAATKAGAEQLANAYANCYGMPVLVTNTMNAIGERAGLEKFLPSTLRKVLLGERVIIHADATRTRPGSRFYIHARNISAALLYLLENANSEGRLAVRYNIVGEKEVNNLELAQTIASIAGFPLDYEMVNWHTSSRPGHDLRYSLSGVKLSSLGFRYPKTFEESLERTIRWTMNNRRWINMPEEDGSVAQRP